MTARGWSPAEVKLLFGLAAQGAGADAIARELKRTKADIREMADCIGADLEQVEHPLICPRCARGYVLGDADWCPACELALKRERWDSELDEERRIADEMEEVIRRAENTLSKNKERQRERWGGNPRKGKTPEERR